MHAAEPEVAQHLGDLVVDRVHEGDPLGERREPLGCERERLLGRGRARRAGPAGSARAGSPRCARRGRAWRRRGRCRARPARGRAARRPGRAAPGRVDARAVCRFATQPASSRRRVTTTATTAAERAEGAGDGRDAVLDLLAHPTRVAARAPARRRPQLVISDLFDSRRCRVGCGRAWWRVVGVRVRKARADQVPVRLRSVWHRGRCARGPTGAGRRPRRASGPRRLSMPWVLGSTSSDQSANAGSCSAL